VCRKREHAITVRQLTRASPALQLRIGRLWPPQQCGQTGRKPIFSLVVFGLTDLLLPLSYSSADHGVHLWCAHIVITPTVGTRRPTTPQSCLGGRGIVLDYIDDNASTAMYRQELLDRLNDTTHSQSCRHLPPNCYDVQSLN